MALTIAGSDSGGGAGIQADLKTFQHFGVFGASVVTAVTAQDTVGVGGCHSVPPDMVRQQLGRVVGDLRPLAFKTGMLADQEIVSVVAEVVQEMRVGGHPLANSFVLDPVMVSTSGDRLLTGDAENRLITDLIPLARLVTPNLSEAGVLAGREVTTLVHMREVARELVAMGANAVLIKGGHLESAEPSTVGEFHLSGHDPPDEKRSGPCPATPVDEKVFDLLWDGSREFVWQNRRIANGPFHGSGCTLSAAVTASLALGDGLLRAVGNAIGFVNEALRSAHSLGAGAMPLNHSAPLRHDPPVSSTRP